MSAYKGGKHHLEARYSRGKKKGGKENTTWKHATAGVRKKEKKKIPCGSTLQGGVGKKEKKKIPCGSTLQEG
jgi:hypothetical protein